jgi:hypothetical protein
MAPKSYFETTVRRYLEGWIVDFSSDLELDLPPTLIKLKPEQIVIGLANGWVEPEYACSRNPGVNKFVYIPPDGENGVGAGYDALVDAGTQIRGFMFWSIGEEGRSVSGNGHSFREPIYMAEKMNSILKIRAN